MNRASPGRRQDQCCFVRVPVNIKLLLTDKQFKVCCTGVDKCDLIIGIRLA